MVIEIEGGRSGEAWKMCYDLWRERNSRSRCGNACNARVREGGVVWADVRLMYVRLGEK